MFLIDVLIVLFLFYFLFRIKQFNLLNPAVIYLLIHTLFVTLRSLQVNLFDFEIINNRNYGFAVNDQEINKAILLADIGIVSFFIGFYTNVSNFKKRGINNLIKYPKIIEARPFLLNYYLSIVFFLGMIGILAFTYLPGIGRYNVEANLLGSMLSSFGIISIIILIYEKGFKVHYLILFILFIFIFSVQGFARFRAILPLVFILLYYLKVNHLKFPPIKFIVIAAFVFILSFPLKEVGLDLKAGRSINIPSLIENSFNNIISGEAGDLAFIEQSAAMIGNIDHLDKIFYGKTYTSILFFYVPRSMWKDKPKLNEWQFEISDNTRNFAAMGQISLITGEAYANFRYFGVILILLLLGRFYSFIYHSYSNLDAKHKGFLILLLFNMILFQVWRDGLISLFLFPLLNYMPIIGLYLIKRHPAIAV